MRACARRRRPAVGRAHRVEDGEHPVLLDELAGVLDRQRRVVRVVVEGVRDPASVHASGFVHVVEVGLRARAHGPERGCLAREVNGAPEEHGGRRDARVLDAPSARSRDDN